MRSLRAGLGPAFFMLFSTTGFAWAQDYSDQMPGMDALAGPGPDYGLRIVILLVAAAVGFAVGAFFSPLLKPFRRIVWWCLLALAVVFALFGPSPGADALNGFVAFVVFLIALALGRPAPRAKNPRACGSN